MRADKDGSGSIDVNEFDAAFNDLYQEYSKHMIEASQKKDILEKFEEVPPTRSSIALWYRSGAMDLAPPGNGATQSLVDVKENLLSTVKELPRSYQPVLCSYFLGFSTAQYGPVRSRVWCGLGSFTDWEPRKPASGVFHLRTGTAQRYPPKLPSYPPTTPPSIPTLSSYSPAVLLRYLPTLPPPKHFSYGAALGSERYCSVQLLASASRTRIASGISSLASTRLLSDTAKSDREEHNFQY
eukprot:2736470-Rhodomonas_salina.1